MAANTDNPALREAWHEVANKDTATNWCLLEFDGASKNMKVAGQGCGGLEELKSHLSDDAVAFGAFRVIGVDDRSTTTSRRPKFVFITWLGPNVSVLKKARVSIQRAQVMKVFDGIQIAYDIPDRDSFTKEEIIKLLCTAGGAHKPTYYEFAEGDQLALDFYENPQ
mmetsp:Transcript_1495/g.3519  ORF Transcript_1495/g.3519 Transcript_1495/m.3519 type:complete len:166 (+) Transcript_1495:158-655(+)|eukprot:CAMPEP_0177629704 /NCGR_PEP_ID=MMETSP0447-20121125/811_1 /TAXON_ID=0 /ORGANISM="Stygamoeba regulata, Strain BSH-02190019" /LENGTH=165 /DNA_ID=CAMNT_0019131045 /DNA_START=88 /DNA_END=585 /DNA_ORIENTATION=+